MPDRIPSDHPSVTTHRVTVTRHGGRRRRLTVPADAVPVDEVVQLIIDDDRRYAVPHQRPAGEEALLSGAYATPDLARDPGDATDYLTAWLADHDVSTGATVLLDEIEPSVAYALRRPGQDAVYEAVDPPTSSLQDIAQQLEESD